MEVEDSVQSECCVKQTRLKYANIDYAEWV